MKFGICCSPESAMNDYPKKADYVELSAMAVRDLAPEQYNALKAEVEKGSIITYSSNGLVPADVRLTGPDVNWTVVRNYCDEVFYKLAELKIKMLVFGSSKAKHVPDGFSREKAWDQLYEVGNLFADTAAKYGQMVVVEPLSYTEVNIVNTVQEGAEYSRTLNRDNFKLLVDFYHFDHNEEDWASLERNKDLLIHAHIATAKTRTRPQSKEDWAFFTKCLGVLKKIGYTGDLSFEGGGHAGELMSEMVVRMKEIYPTV